MELYVTFSVLSKSPVNVLSYFPNLKNKKEKHINIRTSPASHTVTGHLLGIIHCISISLYPTYHGWHMMDQTLKVLLRASFKQFSLCLGPNKGRLHLQPSPVPTLSVSGPWPAGLGKSHSPGLRTQLYPAGRTGQGLSETPRGSQVQANANIYGVLSAASNSTTPQLRCS